MPFPSSDPYDLAFLPEGQLPPPQFVFSLIARLNLETADRTEQEAGIRSWLAGNEPSLKLRADLIEEGFGHLLTDRVTA
ncbi:MAG: hypothetical protein U0904_03610 [Candidatus Nanopelagicales bacterium]|nr:hypothetical protein [Candidatus Nanopelagicales bacterium]